MESKKKKVYVSSLQEAIEQVPDPDYREELEYQLRLYNEICGPDVVARLDYENEQLRETIGELEDKIDELEYGALIND